jgi:hypothetical protein
MSLIRIPQLADPDGFYEELVEAQRELPDAESRKLMAKLVLLLANHIGDRHVLSEAIRRLRGQAVAVLRHAAVDSDAGQRHRRARRRSDQHPPRRQLAVGSPQPASYIGRNKWPNARLTFKGRCRPRTDRL